MSTSSTPDDREFARETVERAREEAQPFLFDHRIVLPDGGVRWTQSRGRVVTDHEGRPLRMVGRRMSPSASSSIRSGTRSSRPSRTS